MLIYSLIIVFLILLYFLATRFGVRRYNEQIYSRGEKISLYPNILKLGSRVQPYLGTGYYHIAQVPLTPFVSEYKQALLRPELVKSNFLCYNLSRLTKSRDQGLCGSCWAFSIASFLGDRASISTNGSVVLELSVQQLLSCFGDGVGCEKGASPEDVLIELEKQQTLLTIEKNNKYKQLVDTEIKTKCRDFSIYPSGLRVKRDSVKSLAEFIPEENPSPDIVSRNVSNIKNELINNGPVFAVMTIYDDFYSYDGNSVYKHDKSLLPTGGHAIEIIGYSDEGVDFRSGIDGEPYWICRNSWGTNWPLKSRTSGIFAIRMGVNECGIESRVGCAEPYGFVSTSKTNFYSMKFTNFYSFLNNPYKKDFFI